MDPVEDRVGLLTQVHEHYGIPDSRPEWMRGPVLRN